LGAPDRVTRAAFLLLALLPPTSHAQELASFAEAASGQELIYRGRYGAAQLYFSDLARQYPADPVAPTLEAAALIWWGEALEEETHQADSVDALLASAVERAEASLAATSNDSERVRALFWLGTALGYRARQAELRGRFWRAALDARAMRRALDSAVTLDSTCVDCLLGLAVYDYALARAGALARLVARLIGLGSGNADLALARLRRVSEEGLLARTEARWVYANALLRESRADPALREESRRMVGELLMQYPDNPVFRRFLESRGPEP
jgi:hypothetical protein